MTISVEEAVAAFTAEAEQHEREQAVEFCEDVRVKLVVFVMLHLGLGLWSLGEVAENLAVALEMNEEQLEADEWPDKLEDAHG